MEKEWTEKKVLYLQKIAQDIVSLDRLFHSQDGTYTLGDIMPDDRPGPEEIAINNDRREVLLDLVKSLSPKQQRVIIMRYGLEDGRNMTLEEIGKKFNITREYVRLIEKKALERLRIKLQEKIEKKEDI